MIITTDKELKTILVLFGIFLAALPLTGQYLLFRIKQDRRVLYEVGDEIKLKLRPEGEVVSGRIEDLADSSIIMFNTEIELKNISHVYADRRVRNNYMFKYKMERVLLIGGVGYLVIDAINSGDLDPNTLTVSGVLIGLGLAFKFLISDWVSINDIRKLMILDLEPG